MKDWREKARAALDSTTSLKELEKLEEDTRDENWDFEEIGRVRDKIQGTLAWPRIGFQYSI